MHGFGAVEIQNAEDLWCVAVGRNTPQRHARYSSEVHGENACLGGEVPLDALDHHDRCSSRDDFTYNTLARVKMFFDETSSFSILAGSIAESVAFSSHDEGSLSARDLERRF